MSRVKHPWVIFFLSVVGVGIMLRTMPIRPLFAVDAFPDSTTQLASESLTVGSDRVADLSAIWERPLFNVTRTPPEAQVAPVVPQAQEALVQAPTPVLTGTMKNRQGEMIAYVRFGEAVESVRLKVGGFQDPWEVESIGDGVARLRHGENTVELKLNQD